MAKTGQSKLILDDGGETKTRSGEKKNETGVIGDVAQALAKLIPEEQMSATKANTLHTSTQAEENIKTLSKLILDLGSKIETKSGAKLDFALGRTAPVEEWMPEEQMSATKAIKLRTAEQTQDSKSVVKLQQFNPSFFLPERDEIPCRVPECSTTTPRLQPSSRDFKQDLFLCETHRAELSKAVGKRCEEEGIAFSIADFELEDFNGYTYLIGALEKAYMHLMTKPATRNIPQSLSSNSDLVLAEVFLNTRNFLIITNALLNPNRDNVRLVFAPYFFLFDRIINDPELLPRLVTALREIMNIALNFFGIIYAWVFLANPGAQVGGGVGIVLGGLLGGIFGFLPGAILGAVGGLVAGNLIGGGAYAWNEEQVFKRQNQRLREYQKFVREQFGEVALRMPSFHTPANPRGDLEATAPPNCRPPFSF